MRITTIIKILVTSLLISCGLLPSGDDGKGEESLLNWEDGVNVTTWAGSEAGYRNGDLDIALFKSPTDIDIDSEQNFYVADAWNFVVRKINTDGVVTTWAGKELEAGDSIEFWPWKVAVGIKNDLYVVYPGDYQIYHVTEDTIYSFAGNVRGDVDGTLEEAQFSTINDIVVALDGTIYVSMGVYADGSHKIKRITPDGLVETFAGTGESGHLDGFRKQALFHRPSGLALDSNEEVLYVATNGTIRTIDLSTEEVQTLAGSPFDGENFSWENRDGDISEAKFKGIKMSIGLDENGTIYVLQSFYNLIRKISKDGVVTTVAGQDSPVGGNINGEGQDAEFNYPLGFTIDDEGSLYIADYYNNSIRKITFDN